MKYEIEQTDMFNKWLKAQDHSIKARILSRLHRITEGNFGDHKELGPDLFELRMTFGGGIRIYYTLQNERIVLLISGGNKNRQATDIKKAKQILTELNTTQEDGQHG